MRDGVLRRLSFGPATGGPRPPREEPRLVPPDRPSPFPRPTNPDPEFGSGVADGEPGIVTLPTLRVADRSAAAPSRRAAGSLPFLAIAGCVAIAIVAIVGVGFLRFAAPENAAATASGHDFSSATPVKTEPATAPPAPAAATSALPAAIPAQPAPVTAPAPKLPQDVATAPPPSPSGNAPSQDVAAAAPPSPSGDGPSGRAASVSAAGEKTVSTAAARSLAAAPPVEGAQSGAEHSAGHFSPKISRTIHTRAAARHIHLRSAHLARPPEPQPRPAPRSSDQAASFDRLMGQLTGPAKPAGAVLTPPDAGAPDPFVARPRFQ